MKKKHISPISRILIIYNIFFVILSFTLCKLVPTLLNYPPNSINNEFETTIDDGYHFDFQISIIVIALTVISNIYIFFNMRSIRKYKLYINKDDDESKSKLNKIVKKCFKLSAKFYLAHVALPSIVVILVLVLTGVEQATMLFRIFIVALTDFVALGLFTQTLANELRDEVLTSVKNREKHNLKNSLTFSENLTITMIPLLALLVLFFIITTNMLLAKEKAEFLTNDYQKQITIENGETLDLNTAITELNKINKNDNKDTLFIISRDEVLYQDNDEEISDFFTKYTFNVAKNGHTYGYYATWIEGVYRLVNIDGIECAVGVMYDTTASPDYTSYLLIVMDILIVIYLIFSVVFSKNKSRTVERMAKKLEAVANGDIVNYDDKLPVLSNNEMGDLAIAYNRILDIEKKHNEEMERNKEILIESERLSSVGQLIGGMAHNLKTPIMSIAGACKALEELTKEYHDSVNNSQVTAADHYDIAKDMNEWIEKIKTYNEYMTEVINATKGQAVSMNANTVSEFSIGELNARIKILMREQLLQRGCTLNVESTVAKDTVVKGEISAIVQVIDNLIVNAMDAYNGKQGKINLSMQEDGNKIYIQIQDFAGGIAESVKDKLFKQMITTKGKAGTGLGLYMCYSTIKGKFNGDMRFETEEGKGTTFFIELSKK